MSLVRTMTRLSHALVLFSLLFGMHSWGPVAARDTSSSWRSLNAKRLEVAKRWELSERGRNGDARRSADTSAHSRVKNITFSNPKASRAYARVHPLSSLRLMRFQSFM